jgi:hypothetical protein
MDRESSSNTKVDDADDIQKEYRRLINVKRAQRRHCTVKTTSREAITSTTSPRVIVEPSSTLAGTPAISLLPGGRSVKKWKPTALHATNTLPSTWGLLGSASQKPWNNPPAEKRLPIQRNDSRKPSTGNACAT